MCEQIRCKWAEKDPYSLQYHDEQWGRPVYDDRLLFEMLVLESFQAGLSWALILKRREAFVEAFEGFRPAVVAAFGPEKVEELLENEGIIRSRGKIESAIGNAKVFLQIQEEYGSFSSYIWGFTNGEIIKNMDDTVLTHSPLSDEISKDLKRRGMKYVGGVIIYSYLEAIGVMNNHETACYLY